MHSLFILGRSFMQVSCGGQHMLVLASPRSPEDQLDVPGLESYYAKMNYNQPLSALAARARHRAKVRSSISIRILNKLCSCKTKKSNNNQSSEIFILI